MPFRSRIVRPFLANSHAPRLYILARAAHRQRSMDRIIRLFLGSLLMLSGCSSPQNAGPGPSNAELADPEPYVRIGHADSNHVSLQIAAREFLPARKGRPVIWLTGVSHIGESNYYAAIQAHLDRQTLVLFEGVGAAERERSSGDADQSQSTTDTMVKPEQNADYQGSLQSAMASSLGLVFQLDAIDYHRDNFRNSDLSITQLRQLIAQQETGSGKQGASEGFEDLMSLMEGNSFLDSLIQFALRFLGTNPKFQALGRLTLIDLLGQLQGDPSRLEGLPPELKQLLEVLLQRRNEKVVADLKTDLKRIGGHGSMAIFFGTGHMPDMEKRIRNELKYRPARDVWFTVFDVDLLKSQIAPSERAFIDNIVQWQLKEASRAKAK